MAYGSNAYRQGDQGYQNFITDEAHQLGYEGDDAYQQVSSHYYQGNDDPDSQLWNLYQSKRKKSNAGPAPTPQPSGPMGGLQQAIEQPGPTPGWADDPALAQTSAELGQRTGSPALEALSQIVSKRGRMY